MIVRRFLAAALLAVLAVPALASTPRAGHGTQTSAAPIPSGMGTRVFARADGTFGVVAASPASPTPESSASPAAAAASNADTTAKARAEFDAWQSGTVDRSHDEARAKISDAMIAAVSPQLQTLGAVQEITQLEKTTDPAGTRYLYRIRCANPPALEMILRLDTAGKYAGIFFRPTAR